MISRFLLTISAIAVLGMPSLPAASSALIVTFKNIPNRVRHDNPDLAAARLRIQEALGRMNQAGRRSNPELEGGLEQNHHFREGRIELGISQRFPLTDRLRLEKSISLTEVKAAEAEVREVERQLVAKARTILVDVLAYRQQRSVLEKQAKVAEEFAKFTAEAVPNGEISPIDAGQAKLEVARIASEIRRLRASEVAEVGALKPLLGMRTNAALNVSGALPAATFSAGLVDPNRRPDFQVAKLDAEAATRAIDLEKARRYEDIEVGLVAGMERSEDVPSGFENEGIIGIRVKLALPFWDKNEGNIQAAEARAQRKEKEIVALAHNIRHEAGAARKEMVEWSKMLRDVSDELLPLAAKQSAAAVDAYRDGLGDLQAVLRAREQRLQLEASRIEALRSFHHARVRFEAAVGNP